MKHVKCFCKSRICSDGSGAVRAMGAAVRCLEAFVYFSAFAMRFTTPATNKMHYEKINLYLYFTFAFIKFFVIVGVVVAAAVVCIH